MITIWEQAKPEQYPIVAYLCYESSLAIFDSRGRLTGERRDYRMRLPYTESALSNRMSNWRDVPDWIIDTLNNLCYDIRNQIGNKGE